MTMQAQFRSGNPVMGEYTPGAAVSAGDVVVLGEMPCVAHAAIAANELGALAAGGGIYRVTAAGPLAAGALVYWDDTNNKVTATATGNKAFGFVAPGSSASADGDAVDVVHYPGVRAGA